MEDLEELEKALRISRAAYNHLPLPTDLKYRGESITSFGARFTMLNPASQPLENDLLRQTLSSISTKEDLLSKKTLDALLLHFLADSRGDVNQHIEKKLHLLTTIPSD